MNGWKSLKYRLTGACPVIFHNGRLADPLDPIAKELKKVSGKKAKTDADHERIAELEFKGSLYLGQDGRPIMPPEGIEAIIVAGAKKSKEGQVAKAGVLCQAGATLKYEGPNDADGLWKDQRFTLRAPVKVGTSRIVRTRPKFDDWSCEVELLYDPTTCNEQQVTDWLKTAGEKCGAFDWRPKYGRFTVAKVA